MVIACWSRAVLLALLVQCVARGALAQVSPPAASCAVAPQWAADSAAEVDGPSTVQVRITGGPSHWFATLRVRYANGSAGLRRLSARSCAELQRAVAVTLSLLDAGSEPLEPAATGREAIAPTTTPRVTPAAATTPRVTLATPGPRSSATQEVAAQVSPAAVLAPPVRLAGNAADGGPDRDGLGPGASSRRAFVRVSSLLAVAGTQFAELGVALAGSLWLGSWGARAELSARRPLTSVPAERGFSVQLQRYVLGLEPCVRRIGSVEWGLCSGPRLELVRGLSVGPSEPATDQVWLPGWGGGGWLRLPLSASWGLSAELQASWSLRRAQASVEPWGKVYELPRFGSSLLFGVEWSL